MSLVEDLQNLSAENAPARVACTKAVAYCAAQAKKGAISCALPIQAKEHIAKAIVRYMQDGGCEASVNAYGEGWLVMIKWGRPITDSEPPVAKDMGLYFAREIATAIAKHSQGDNHALPVIQRANELRELLRQLIQAELHFTCEHSAHGYIVRVIKN